jgi:hypothetical protein
MCLSVVILSIRLPFSRDKHDKLRIGRWDDPLTYLMMPSSGSFKVTSHWVTFTGGAPTATQNSVQILVWNRQSINNSIIFQCNSNEQLSLHSSVRVLMTSCLTNWTRWRKLHVMMACRFACTYKLLMSYLDSGRALQICGNYLYSSVLNWFWGFWDRDTFDGPRFRNECAAKGGYLTHCGKGRVSVAVSCCPVWYRSIETEVQIWLDCQQYSSGAGPGIRRRPRQRLYDRPSIYCCPQQWCLTLHTITVVPLKRWRLYSRVFSQRRYLAHLRKKAILGNFTWHFNTC